MEPVGSYRCPAARENSGRNRLSSEKDYMSCPKRAADLPEKNDTAKPPREAFGKAGRNNEMHATESHPARARRSRPIERAGVLVEMNRLARTRSIREDRPLRCVSSGYMAGGCSCQCAVPAAAAEAAWTRELALEGNGEDRLFHFAWRGEVWLAYGLAGGEIRGVYCPTHRAAREAHAAGRRPRRLPWHAAAAVGA
jgi:hypothetical protein